MWQQASSWQPDLISILIGIVGGIALVIILMRLISRLASSEESYLDRLWESLPWTGDDIEERYRAGLLAFLQAYHLGGKDALLDKIFVPPRLVSPDVDWVDHNYAHWQSSLLYALWPITAGGLAIPPPPSISVRQLLLRGQRVVISSPDGAGKSTLLAYCAYVCSTAETDEGRFSALSSVTPVFAHIAELILVGFDTSTGEGEIANDPLAPLVKIAMERTGTPIHSRIENFVRQSATDGQLLLLLDGWDEISSPVWNLANEWLKRFLIAYPDCRVIMAGPLRGYGSLRQQQFNVIGLLPWRKGQVEEFCTRWASAEGYNGHIHIGQYWQPGQSALETHLRLQSILHDAKANDSGLPHRWVELMESSLLRELPNRKEVTEQTWLAPATRELWQEIAFHLLKDGQPSLSKNRIKTIINSILVDYEVQKDERSTGLLYDTLINSRFFVFWNDEHISLLNPVWRDYLTAGYLAQSQSRYKAIELVYEPAWRNTLGFYAGRAGASELAPRMMAGGRELINEHQFTLAEWLPEAPDGGEWRRQIMISLGRLVVDNAQPRALRQRAAAAMATSKESGVDTFMRQLLRQSDPALRQVAIAALAKLLPTDSVEMNSRMLSDVDAGVRSSAVHALAWVNEPTAQAPLLVALAQPDDSLYRAAAEGLALNNTVESCETLREAIEDPLLHKRQAAIYGLALIDEDWAADLLSKVASEDEQWIIRSTADEVLKEQFSLATAKKWTPIQAGEQNWLIEWAVSQGRSVPIGQSAIPIIAEALTDPDSSIRAAAAATLGALEIRQATSVLQASLKDPEEEVRYAAFVALCQIGRAWDEPVYGGNHA